MLTFCCQSWKTTESSNMLFLSSTILENLSQLVLSFLLPTCITSRA